MDRQLLCQMFVKKLFIVHYFLSVIQDKCFKTKGELKSQNELFLKYNFSGNTSAYQGMTEYLSLRRRPEFFNLQLRLRPPNFLAENFHLSRRFR